MGHCLHSKCDAMAGAGFVYNGGIATDGANPAVIFVIVCDSDNVCIDVDWIQTNTAAECL